METIDIHLDLVVVATGGKETRVGRAPADGIAARLVGLQLEQVDADSLVPDVQVTIWKSAILV